jgi:general secretion pathway protein M
MAGGNYLKSGTEAVAGAELQRRITEIAAANEAQIVSTRILPATNETGFVRIAIKVRMQGSLPAILASLYDIESDEVFMFLDNTSVRDRMAGRAAARQGYRLMEADLDVIAYMPDVS